MAEQWLLMGFGVVCVLAYYFPCKYMPSVIRCSAIITTRLMSRQGSRRTEA